MSGRLMNRVVMITAVAAMVGLMGLVPLPVVVRDYFNDNVTNTNFWTVRQIGGVSVAETDKRLQFSADGATGTFSHAGLEVKNWGARWQYDFQIELDYKVGAIGLNAEKEVLLGVWIGFAGSIPQSVTGYGAGVFRDDVGLKLAIGRYANGQVINSQVVPLTDIVGHLVLEYDRSDDRLTARIGANQVHLNGLWSQYGSVYGTQPMVIGIGCTTLGGNVYFPGTRVFFDKFQYEGVKRAR